GLNAQHGLSFVRGRLRVVTSELEHLLQVLQILLSRFGRLRIVFVVVVAIGQGDAALVERGNGYGGIVQVGLGVESKQRRSRVAVHRGDLSNEIGVGLDV